MRRREGNSAIREDPVIKQKLVQLLEHPSFDQFNRLARSETIDFSDLANQFYWQCDVSWAVSDKLERPMASLWRKVSRDDAPTSAKGKKQREHFYMQLIDLLFGLIAEDRQYKRSAERCAKRREYAVTYLIGHYELSPAIATKAAADLVHAFPDEVCKTRAQRSIVHRALESACREEYIVRLTEHLIRQVKLTQEVAERLATDYVARRRLPDDAKLARALCHAAIEDQHLLMRVFSCEYNYLLGTQRPPVESAHVSRARQKKLVHERERALVVAGVFAPLPPPPKFDRPLGGEREASRSNAWVVVPDREVVKSAGEVVVAQIEEPAVVDGSAIASTASTVEMARASASLVTAQAVVDDGEEKLSPEVGGVVSVSGASASMDSLPLSAMTGSTVSMSHSGLFAKAVAPSEIPAALLKSTNPFIQFVIQVKRRDRPLYQLLDRVAALVLAGQQMKDLAMSGSQQYDRLEKIMLYADFRFKPRPNYSLTQHYLHTYLQASRRKVGPAQFAELRPLIDGLAVLVTELSSVASNFRRPAMSVIQPWAKELIDHAEVLGLMPGKLSPCLFHLKNPPPGVGHVASKVFGR